MRRKLVAAALAGGLSIGAGLAFVHTATSSAQPGSTPTRVEVPRQATTQLPINNVVLFSSGVGYFQREGEVQGNARIDLSFPVQDINDLIKSMVLQDAGGGHVSAISYDSQAPLDKTLKSFAINLTNNPTFGQILQQARGEKVEAVLQQTQATQPGTLTGVVMGVEKKHETVGKEAVESEFVNLWCAEGIRSIRLSDVQRMRFLNPTMDSEVKKALETLALSHDTQKKAVSLNFTGEGKRTVKVGYVVENPIWKTSYRLVLDKKGKPYLQGWAVVENTQDEDWTNVRMALISGRPISFQMDLYQPLFVQRPVVEPELFASLRPPTYQGAMEKWGANAAEGRADDGKSGNRHRGLAAGEQAESLRKYAEAGKNLGADKPRNAGVDFRSGVASATTATELGDFFQYAIETPVTLPRQKSALLPIVNEEVEGTKVSIYNQGVHAKFPLLGLRFKNSTKLHLMQGPITVFDGPSYAGDARILDLQPKEERLISYAIDLGTEVEPIVVNPQDNIIKIKINKGIVEATHKLEQAKTYKVKNRSEHDRVLLIEHPYRPEFALVTPAKFHERARDVYRFEVKVEAGGKAELPVVEQREIQNSITLTNSDDNTIRFFLNHNVSSPKVKAALTEALTLKGKVNAAIEDIRQNERRLNDIRTDQQRLRENLKTVPPESEAHKRYVKKFDQQETEIEQLQDTIKKLQDKEFKERKAYEAYLGNLTLE
jgi:hypothetical protein